MYRKFVSASNLFAIFKDTCQPLPPFAGRGFGTKGDLMSKRNDGIAALKGFVPPTAVPIWELEFHTWNQFSKNNVIVGDEFCKLTAKEQDKALQTNTSTILEVADQLEMNAITVPGRYHDDENGQTDYWWLPPNARIKQIELLAKDVLWVACSGITALHSIDPATGMRIAGAKQSIGAQLCLCGNIASDLLIQGHPEKIYTTTRRLLYTAKPKGGFWLGAAHAVRSNVPKQNYLAVIQARRDHGRYP